jgi:hypothetical protein
MRALRVVGLDEDGETVICEDPENGERFSVPADERLRAAARGDLTRLGQVQIELESQMRPREIQARVRGGASIQEIVSTSGLPEQRVERYAHPVLLERAQIAEMAQRAHPVREDGPDVQTLGEIVAHTFGMRGHDYGESEWDSWRGDDNKWVVRLRWNAGKSDNSAHWVFHPGTQGGTVAALDEHAADLLDPSPTRALRTVRPVTELAREALELDQDAGGDAPEEPAEPAPQAAEPAPERPSILPPPVAQQPEARPQRDTREDRSPAPPAQGKPAQGQSTQGQPASDETARADGTQIQRGSSQGTQRTPSIPTLDLDTGPNTGSSRVGAVPDAKTPASGDAGSSDGPAHGEQPAQAEDAQEAAEDKSSDGQRRGRKNHPIVPSWEDVLLGVRSNR